MPSRWPSAAPRTRTNPKPSEHGPGTSALTDTYVQIHDVRCRTYRITRRHCSSHSGSAYCRGAATHSLTPSPMTPTAHPRTAQRRRHHATPRVRREGRRVPAARDGPGGRRSQRRGGDQVRADVLVAQRPVRVDRDLGAEQVRGRPLELEYVEQVPVIREMPSQAAREPKPFCGQRRRAAAESGPSPNNAWRFCLTPSH